MKKKIIYFIYISLLVLSACEDVSMSRDYNDIAGGNDVSTGGSLASFVIQGNSLFTINNDKLVTYDISDPTSNIPVNLASVSNEFGNTITNLETIFPYGDHLFLGATDGMYIINIKDPTTPQFVSCYEHIQNCDPVVVQDSFAYVTLREGMHYWNKVNVLQVINISDLTAPVIEATYDMVSPYGLGIDGDYLYVCDDGKLKIMNCVNPKNIKLIESFEQDDIFALDVIPYNHNIIVLGESQLNQYSYSTVNSSLELLSSISNQ